MFYTVNGIRSCMRDCSFCMVNFIFDSVDIMGDGSVCSVDAVLNTAD
jgi:DNA repair photolyase